MKKQAGATGEGLRPHTVATASIITLLLLIGLGTGFLLWRSYDATREQVRQSASSSSQVVAANIKWAVETARQLLRRVDDSLGADLTAPPPEAADQLSGAIATLPGEVKVYVVDAGGTTRLTTDPQFKPIDVRDREYFSSVRDGEAFHITPLLVSRLNGEQIFTISKRIERNGQFAGAAILSFNSTLLQDVWASLGLDDISTVGLLREDGQLVSRFPLPEGPLDLSKYVLFTEYLPKASNGIYETTSPADGIHRVVGYRRVPGTDLVAVASLATTTAFASFNAAMNGILAIAIPGILALAFIAWWTFRMLRADARRREAEAQFRTLAEAMPNHVWSSGPAGLLDWFNSRVYEYSGAGEGELDGAGWSKIVHPDDLPAASAAWMAAVQSGRQYETQFRIRNAEGTYRWHIVRAVPVAGADGRVSRWIGTNTDIDDEKRTTQALHESEARLRLAIEAGQLAVWELDIASLRITPSPALNRLYGFPEDVQPTLAEYQSRYAPGELERVSKLSGEAMARGDTDLEVELRHLWPDGTEKWLLIRSQVASGASRAIGVVIDVTERRHVEEQLRQSERRFRLSQHAAGIASLEVDVATGTVLGSDRFWEIWGLGHRDSVHISLLENIVLPEDKDVRSNEETRRAGTSVPNVEYRIRRPDTGELRWLSRHIEFVHDESGRPTKMFGVMQDITEQKEARSRQEVLTHELSHRIKNILAMVSALASQTLRDTDLETGRESLMQRLRALATAHDALIRTQWTEADLKDILQSTLAHLPEDRWTLSGPPVALQPKMALSMALAANELATNALKYGALSNDDGHIEIEWRIEQNTGDGALTWSWSEHGGPITVAPTRRGFGNMLITRVLAADFSGAVRIEYAPHGIEVVLSAPHPAAAVHTVINTKDSIDA